MKYRIEFDSIGKIKVPGDKYCLVSVIEPNQFFNIGDLNWKIIIGLFLFRIKQLSSQEKQRFR